MFLHIKIFKKPKKETQRHKWNALYKQYIKCVIRSLKSYHALNFLHMSYISALQRELRLSSSLWVKFLSIFLLPSLSYFQTDRFMARSVEIRPLLWLWVHATSINSHRMATGHMGQVRWRAWLTGNIFRPTALRLLSPFNLLYFQPQQQAFQRPSCLFWFVV